MSVINIDGMIQLSPGCKSVINIDGMVHFLQDVYLSVIKTDSMVQLSPGCISVCNQDRQFGTTLSRMYVSRRTGVLRGCKYYLVNVSELYLPFPKTYVWFSISLNIGASLSPNQTLTKTPYTKQDRGLRLDSSKKS